MNCTFLGIFGPLAQTALSRRQYARFAVPALVVCMVMCVGGGIAAAQTLEDLSEDETVADGGTCMADEASVPLDPIGDPAETAAEVDPDTGIFQSPLDSPQAAAGAFDGLEAADQDEQGFSLIPEPGTLLTLALAVLMLLLLRRKW